MWLLLGKMVSWLASEHAPLFIRMVIAPGDKTKISATRLVAARVLIANPAVKEDGTAQGSPIRVGTDVDGSQYVVLHPGDWIELNNVDLSKIEVKNVGSADEEIYVVGHGVS